jgi:hypothetical protein
MAASENASQPETSTVTLMLGYLCIKGVEGLNEKVAILDRFGLADADIARICNAKEQSVRNARQRNKKTSGAE